MIAIGACAIIAHLPTTKVHVTGADWVIHYDGSASGYFGPSPQSTCTSCPLTVSKNAQFPLTLTFTSNATARTHTIDDFSVNTPFALVSIPPALPISVTPGGTATVTITIRAPSNAGNYVVSGAMDTT